MNPFSSDKAPYAIALLISALGWAFAALHGGLQDSLVATYQVQRRDAEVVGTLTNLSKTKALGPVRFMLACQRERPCLVNDAQSPRFAMEPPTGLASGLNEFENVSDLSAEFTIALPPGGAVSVKATTRNRDPVVLLMLPKGDKPEAVYLLPSSSPVAWFIHRYYLLVLTLTALFLAAFGGWLVHSLLAARGGPTKGAPADEKASRALASEPAGDGA